MKRYYCKNCGAELKIDGNTLLNCPICDTTGFMLLIPDYETVGQWEARTGWEYPSTAPVYIPDEAGFNLVTAEYCLKAIAIVATEAGAPPKVGAPTDEWRTE